MQQKQLNSARASQVSESISSQRKQSSQQNAAQASLKVAHTS
jgi:hypothetical protein